MYVYIMVFCGAIIEVIGWKLGDSLLMKVLSKAENAYDVINQLWLHNRHQPIPIFKQLAFESNIENQPIISSYSWKELMLLELMDAGKKEVVVQALCNLWLNTINRMYFQ